MTVKRSSMYTVIKRRYLLIHSRRFAVCIFNVKLLTSVISCLQKLLLN